jgi:hypothetical protein
MVYSKRCIGLGISVQVAPLSFEKNQSILAGCTKLWHLILRSEDGGTSRYSAGSAETQSSTHFAQHSPSTYTRCSWDIVNLNLKHQADNGFGDVLTKRGNLSALSLSIILYSLGQAGNFAFDWEKNIPSSKWSSNRHTDFEHLSQMMLTQMTSPCPIHSQSWQVSTLRHASPTCTWDNVVFGNLISW